MEKRIFVVEDDAALLYGLESHFSSEGFETETSMGDEDIDEIINKIKDFGTEYLILDLILPKNDGFEIVKKIKEDEELADLPIFIFTDLSDEDSKNRSLKMGIDYYFIKDEFETYEFAEKVVKIINNKDHGRSGEDDGDDDTALDFMD
ncbi:MAG: response regulator [Patescibacteria group bacterium]|nr:response regulator [Patescibacteria group bacterium]